MDKEEKRLPFTGSNSELLAVRIPKALFKAIETEAEKKGVPLPDYIRVVLYNFYFIDIVSGYFEKVKAQLGEPGDTQQKLVELDEHLEEYVKNVSAVMAENDEIQNHLSDSLRKVQELRADIKKYAEKVFSSAVKMTRKVAQEIGRLNT